MFQLILGRSGTGKTEYIADFLCETARSWDKIFFIVPDQFSFESEKLILNKAGERLASKIKVFSFSRLAEDVMRIYGGAAKKRLDDSGKSLIMNLAIEACSDNLNVFSKTGDRLTALMLQSVEEFKSACITPEMILEKCRESGQGLKDKLYEMGLIYAAYDSIVHASYTDPSDVMTFAAEKLCANDYFDGAVVVIDAFESFNRQKREIIKSAFIRAEGVYVSLCTDSVHNKEVSIFTPVTKTAAQLNSLALENGVNVAVPKLFNTNLRSENPELNAVEKNLFAPFVEVHTEEPNAVHVFEGATVYEELEFVAAEIRRLVIEEKYNYGDFSVICRNPDKYYMSLSGVFEKWQIPCYFSKPERIDSQPLIRLVISIFNIINMGYRTEDILILLKTGLCCVTNEEISLLENYVFTWKISGKAWKDNFSKHPKGYGYVLDDASTEELALINDIRLRIVGQLMLFSDKCKNADCETICKELYNLLEALEVPAMIAEKAKALKNFGQQERSDNAGKVWKKLMDTLDQFVSAMGEKIISLQRVSSFLKSVLSGEETRDIPMRFDTVLFGSADSVMQAAPKVTFIVGAVQGEFPMTPSQSGLLSDKEKEKLRDISLPLENNLEDITLLEKFNAYKAAVGASERLYVSYHISYGSEDLAPSELVDSIKQIFPMLKTEKCFPDEFYISTKEAAFSAFAAHYRNKDVLAATLAEYLGEDERLEGRIDAIKRAADKSKIAISNKQLSKGMFSDSYISASQIDAFHHCRFEYFCKYGLNARERQPAEINVLEYGTLMHYLFENIFRSDFRQYVSNPQKLRIDLDNLIKSYADENMGGFTELAPRDLYRFKRMADTAETLIFRVIDELAESKFTPEYFELMLSDRGDFPPLKIKTKSGEVINVGGIIDRVDVYDSPNGKYVRIIDYKTGRKEFKLFDVLYGLNLQMLIYLAALSANKKLLPAGVLYMPSSMPTVSGAKGMSSADIDKEKNKKLRMNGVVLNDTQIIQAMEASAEGKYIPVAIKKDGKLTGGENLLSSAQLESVFDYIKNIVATMAEELINGDIDADPLMMNANSCSWCPYGSVCLSQRDDRLVYSCRMKKDDVINKMSGKGDKNGEMD